MESHSKGENYDKKLAFLSLIFNRSYRIHAENPQFLCPNPNCSSHEKDKLKLSLNVETGKHNCWVCGFRGNNILNLVNRINPKYAHTARKIWNITHENEILSEETTPVVDLQLPGEVVPLFLESNNSDVKSAQAYLETRGIDKRDCLQWNLCLYRDAYGRNRILVPSFDSENKLNFWATRLFEAHDTFPVKYWISDVNRTEIIWNEYRINWNKPLILVEGTFDAMRVGGNVTALLSNTLSSTSLLYERIYRNKTPVVIMLDNDARDRAERLAYDLSWLTQVQVWTLPREFKDPSEVPKSLNIADIVVRASKSRSKIAKIQDSLRMAGVA